VIVVGQGVDVVVVVVVVVVLVQTGLLPVVTVVRVVVVSEVLSPIMSPPETEVISLGVSSRIESLSTSNINVPLFAEMAGEGWLDKHWPARIILVRNWG